MLIPHADPVLFQLAAMMAAYQRVNYPLSALVADAGPASGYELSFILIEFYEKRLIVLRRKLDHLPTLPHLSVYQREGDRQQ